MPKKTRLPRSPSTNHVQSVSFCDFKVPMLQSDNWIEWKWRMGAFLAVEGLGSCISPDAEAPMKAVVMEGMGNGRAEGEELERIAQWQKEDAMARILIESAISNSEKVHLRGATTARQMWEQLCKVKEYKTPQQILVLCRELLHTTAAPGCDLETHFSNLLQLREELHLAGQNIEDQIFAMTLVASLSTDWDDFISSYFVTRANQSTISSDDVIKYFIEVETLRKITRSH